MRAGCLLRVFNPDFVFLSWLRIRRWTVSAHLTRFDVLILFLWDPDEFGMDASGMLSRLWISIGGHALRIPFRAYLTLGWFTCVKFLYGADSENLLFLISTAFLVALLLSGRFLGLEAASHDRMYWARPIVFVHSLSIDVTWDVTDEFCLTLICRCCFAYICAILLCAEFLLWAFSLNTGSC